MDTKENIEKKLDEIKFQIYTEAKKVKDIDNYIIVKNVAKRCFISEDTLKEVVGDVEARNYYRKKYKMLEHLMMENDSEISLSSDFNKARKHYQSSDEYLKETMNKAKFESLITRLKPEEVTPEIIDYLKENNADVLTRRKAIQKFASSIKPEQVVNNEVFDYLYENNYESKTISSPIDLAFKFYCDGKKKDERIESLKEEIREKDETIVEKEKTIIEKDSLIDEKNDTIVGNNNTIRALNLRVKYYEQMIPNIQLKMVEFARTAQKNVFNIVQLRRQEENRERRGIFSKIADKVRTAFKKEKPLLLSSSLHGIQNDMNELTDGLTQIGQTMSKPESQSNLIESIQKQKHIQSKLQPIHIR